MIPSEKCYDLTKSSEGLRLKAYQDTGGVWTIGYGHTGGVVPNSTITSEMASQLLEHDMQYAAQVVNTHAGQCTQSQFDALTDFVFNVGPSQFLGSHLFTYHKNGEYDKAAAEFPKWKYDNGKVEPGLVARRAKEQALYTSQEPQEGHQHTAGSECSASSVPYPVQVEWPVGSSQPSVAQPSLVPSTAPVSNSGLSVSGSNSLAERFRKLIETVGKKLS